MFTFDSVLMCCKLLEIFFRGVLSFEGLPAALRSRPCILFASVSGIYQFQTWVFLPEFFFLQDVALKNHSSTDSGTVGCRYWAGQISLKTLGHRQDFVVLLMICQFMLIKDQTTWPKPLETLLQLNYYFSLSVFSQTASVDQRSNFSSGLSFESQKIRPQPRLSLPCTFLWTVRSSQSQPQGPQAQPWGHFQNGLAIEMAPKGWDGMTLPDRFVSGQMDSTLVHQEIDTPGRCVELS